MSNDMDSLGRYRAKFFNAMVRSYLEDGSIYENGEFRKKSRTYFDTQIEQALHAEVSTLWRLMVAQNPDIEVFRESIDLLSTDELIALDPPEGRLSRIFKRIRSVEDTRVTQGDRKLRYVTNELFFECGSPCWTYEGRSIRVRFHSQRTVGVSVTVEVSYTAEPKPISLTISPDEVYLELSPQIHPIIALGAALRLMPQTHPSHSKHTATYLSDRGILVADQSSHQSAGPEVYRTGYDFTNAE